MLKLLKGDDTGGVFGRKLQFTIQVASGISLDGCYGEFIFDGITKRFDGPLVSGQTREIFYSHNETAGMALGVRMGAFVLVDAAGKRTTVGNTYAVKVTNIVSEVYTTPTQTVEIYGAIKWSQIEEKPDVVLSVNGVGPDEDGNVEVTAGAADWDLIKNKPEYDGEDLPEEFTEEQMRTKLNDVLDFLRDAFPAALTAVVAAMCFAATAYGELIVDVTKARKGDLLNSAMIVTNVTVSGIGGIDTNAVKDIVNAEVGGTNTLVHSDAAWVITATNQAANARDRWDNVCHTDSFNEWKVISKPDYMTIVGQPSFSSNEVVGSVWCWNVTAFGETVIYAANAGESVESGRFFGRWEDFFAKRSKSSTANQPFVTYDNVPSTNGFVTASVTNGLESASHASATYAPIVDANDHPVVREDGQVHVWQILAVKSFDADYALCDNLGHTISEYYATVDSVPTIATNSVMNASDLWSESNANLTGTVGRVSAPIATNAAEYVVGEVLEYGLTNLSSYAISLRSGEIGNYVSDGTSFILELQFENNGKSADCLLYAANTGASDTSIILTPNTYTYVSTDISKARTLTKATTNIVSFTRVNATTILVSKQEVK